MVDTRLPDRWLYVERFDNLSHGAFRLFALGMMWSNQQLTDGRIPLRFLPTLHPDLETDTLVHELVDAGLVELVDGAIQFVDWAGELGQSSAESIREKRRAAAERQRAFRERKPLRTEIATGDVTRDVGQAQEVALASSPSAYVTSDVTRYERCPRHPDGDKGEPCGTCMRIRQARDGRRASGSDEPRGVARRCARQGHDYADSGYCVRCGERQAVDWMNVERPLPADVNAWMSEGLKVVGEAS